MMFNKFTALAVAALAVCAYGLPATKCYSVEIDTNDDSITAVGYNEMSTAKHHRAVRNTYYNKKDEFELESVDFHDPPEKESFMSWFKTKIGLKKVTTTSTTPDYALTDEEMAEETSNSFNKFMAPYDSSTDDSSTDGTSTDESSADDSSADESSADEVFTYGTSTDGTSTDGMSTKGWSTNAILVNGRNKPMIINSMGGSSATISN